MFASGVSRFRSENQGSGMFTPWFINAGFQLRNAPRYISNRVHTRPNLQRALTVAATKPQTAPLTATANEAVDLQRWAPHGGAWDTPPSKWIVFSDLHVTPRTLPICIDVLKRVRDAALSRSAGVAFLGDFWHIRGNLPVEPLNELVRLFSSEWGVQTVMLVGNHDQVSLGGMVHALTPLAAAAPAHIHVFDGPALYAGALWLPYRRNAHEVADALRVATTVDESAKSSSTTVENGKNENAVQAVFAHVDVVGASMNSLCQARDGLPPSLFPRSMPTYTGHYHKPHIVPGTNIRYVGSPYQVSRAEAGQKKALLVVDRNAGWAVTEEIELDIGPRHFDASIKASSSDKNEAAEAGVLDSSIDGGAVAEKGGVLTLPEGLRRGDRVRIILPRNEFKAQKKAIRSLVARGVSVEVATLPSSEASTPRISNAEHLTPQELFTQYAALRGLNSQITSRGSALLEAVAKDSGGSGSNAMRSVSLSFTAVELEGYFSFKETQRYDLDKRGLVVLTGSVEGATDQEGSTRDGMESNGAGKTALIMAPLWALTGDVDTRSELGAGRGLTNADVVNEDSKIARVRVEGEVDGVPFVVERKVVRRGRGGGLRFELDGKDMTAQDIRLTQEAIDAQLAAPLLGRAVFYGQSEITALLESGDRAFKQELGKVVELDIWGEAKEASKKELSAKKAALDECQRELRVQKEYAAQFASQLEEAQKYARIRESEYAVRMEAVTERGATAGRNLQQAISEVVQHAVDTRFWITHQKIKGQEELIDPAAASNVELQQDDGVDENEAKSRVQQREHELALLRQESAAAQEKKGAAEAQYAGRQRQLIEYMELDETIAEHAAVCDRCLQTIDKEQYDDMVARLTRESESAHENAARAAQHADMVLDRVSNAMDALKKAREEHAMLSQRKATAIAEAQQAGRSRAAGIADAQAVLLAAEKMIESAKKAAGNLLEQGISIDNASHETSVVLEGKSNTSDDSSSSPVAALQQAVASLQLATFDAERCLNDLQSLERELEQSTSSQREVQRLEEWVSTAAGKAAALLQQDAYLETEIEELKAVDDAFKPTGVVSFVVEDSLSALQESASRHLAHLAPGITLELSASRPKAATTSTRKNKVESESSSSGSVEQVEKRVYVRVPGSDEPRQRSIKQLSGGERRRVALALALGFTELAARRGRLRSNLLVLDEVMQHLDGEGCARLAGLLRDLDEYQTVIVVAQARSFMTRAFDAVDVVVKSGGEGGGSVVMSQALLA